MSILDLPIERQREIAKKRNMSFDDWVAETRRSLDRCRAFSQELDANKGIRPEGMTEEDVARFQKKIDSGTPKD